MLNTAFGNTYLLNTLGLLPNFLPNLRNWHDNTLLNNAFGISSVRVTRYLSPPSQNPSGGAFKLLTVLRKVEASLIITFFTVSPSNCAISSSWSSFYTMTSTRLALRGAN